MLVRSAVRSNSTSSSEHDAYLASLLLTSGDDAGSEPAPPANPAESGGATAPPTGSDSRRVPPPFTRGSSLRVKRTNVFVGTRQSDLEKLQNLEAEIASLVLQILGIEREVEKVLECIASGSAYRGRKGEALGAVEGKLVSKELLLREEKKQLRDEKMMLVRLQGSKNSEPKMTSATASSKKIEGVDNCNNYDVGDV